MGRFLKQASSPFHEIEPMILRDLASALALLFSFKMVQKSKAIGEIDSFECRRNRPEELFVLPFQNCSFYIDLICSGASIVELGAGESTKSFK